MAKSIRILNPLPSGSEFTTRGSADRYVRRGRAVYVSERLIRFLPLSEIVERKTKIAAHATAVSAHVARLRRETGGQYDRIKRLLDRKEMKHIPLAGDTSKAMHAATGSASSWAYSAAVHRRIKQADSPERVAEMRG